MVEELKERYKIQILPFEESEKQVVKTFESLIDNPKIYSWLCKIDADKINRKSAICKYLVHFVIFIMPSLNNLLVFHQNYACCPGKPSAYSVFWLLLAQRQFYQIDYFLFWSTPARVFISTFAIFYYFFSALWCNLISEHFKIADQLNEYQSLNNCLIIHLFT